MSSSIPFRYSEKQFRRFEDAIATAVLRFPSTTTFHPAPLSPNTFSCNLRDAMRGFLTYKHQSTRVDREKLNQIRTKMSVYYEAGLVHVGLRKNKATEPVGKETPTFNNLLDSPPDDILTAYCVLLHHRKHPQITVKNHNHELLEKLQKSYDISFEQQGDGTTVVF